MLKRLKVLSLISTLFISGSSISYTLANAEVVTHRELGPDAYKDIKRINDYLSFYRQYPTALHSIGDSERGEIRVEIEPEAIYKIQEEMYQVYKKKGYSESYAKQASRAGIISEDPYIYFIRDAVYFPSGKAGLYDRVLQSSSLTGPNGVGIMPILPDKKIALILNYRHATRSWEIELIRGFREAEELPETAARRELSEESGYAVGDLIHLGSMAVDSSIFNTVVPIYAGEVIALDDSHPEASEAIERNILLSKEEVKKAILEGFLETEIRGEMVKVPFRDPFLTFGLYIAESKGLL